jgi:hypothetical protein
VHTSGSGPADDVEVAGEPPPDVVLVEAPDVVVSPVATVVVVLVDAGAPPWPPVPPFPVPAMVTSPLQAQRNASEPKQSAALNLCRLRQPGQKESFML